MYKVIFLLIGFSSSIVLYADGKGDSEVLPIQHYDCESGTEGHQLFMGALDIPEIKISGVDYLANVAQFSPDCLQLILSNEGHREILAAIIDREEAELTDEFNNTHFDLSALEQLHGYQGTTVSDNLRATVAERLQQASEECRPIDRRAELPPVRDQGMTNWCYAFTAADLVGHRTGQSVSAFDIALNYNQRINQRSIAEAILPPDLEQRETSEESPKGSSETAEPTSAFIGLMQRIGRAYESLRGVFEREGGMTGDAINFTGWNGFCLESELSSNSYEAISLQTLNIAITSLQEASENLMTRNGATDVAYSFCEEHYVLMATYLPGVMISDITQAIEFMNVDDFFRQQAQDRCQNRFSFEEEAQTIHTSNMEGGEPTRRLDSVLNSGQIAGIEYDMALIGRTDQRFDHASSVVGRRWDEENQMCQYLIRNSWGERCDYYPEGMDCENGNFWVNRTALNDHLKNIIHF